MRTNLERCPSGLRGLPAKQLSETAHGFESRSLRQNQCRWPARSKAPFPKQRVHGAGSNLLPTHRQVDACRAANAVFSASSWNACSRTLSGSRKHGRAADCAGPEHRRRGTVREFESHCFRHSQHVDFDPADMPLVEPLPGWWRGRYSGGAGAAGLEVRALSLGRQRENPGCLAQSAERRLDKAKARSSILLTPTTRASP